jgi:hypothetical protein
VDTLQHRYVRVAFLVASSVCVLAACAVSEGTGYVEGTVTVEDCGKSAAPFSLRPTFFAAEAVEDQLEIRIQHESDLPLYSNGMVILVRNATELRTTSIGRPVEMGGKEAPVRADLFLNETCPAERNNTPVALTSQRGLITFTSIYAPKYTRRDVEINARFNGLELADSSDPERRHATLTGEFQFLFTRGRPAQRYP